jgi:hypothetical protein
VPGQLPKDLLCDRSTREAVLYTMAYRPSPQRYPVRARFHSCHDNAPQPARAAGPPKKIPAAPNRAAAFSLTAQSVSLAVRLRNRDYLLRIRIDPTPHLAGELPVHRG